MAVGEPVPKSNRFGMGAPEAQPPLPQLAERPLEEQVGAWRERVAFLASEAQKVLPQFEEGAEEIKKYDLLLERTESQTKRDFDYWAQVASPAGVAEDLRALSLPAHGPVCVPACSHACRSCGRADAGRGTRTRSDERGAQATPSARAARSAGI